MSERVIGETEKFSERHRLLVQVDHEICAGFADCVGTAPDVFDLSDDSLAIILDPDAVEAEVLVEAAEVCPVSAILLFDEDGQQVAPEL